MPRFKKSMDGGCGYCDKQDKCNHKHYNWNSNCDMWKPHGELTHVPTKVVKVRIYDRG